MRMNLIYLVNRNIQEGNFLRYALQANGFPNIRLIPNYDECLYMLQKSQFPDFIITDVEEDRAKCCAFLQQVKNLCSDVRVIFFSSSSDETMADILISCGATDYICKAANGESSTKELIQNLGYLCRSGVLD
jgi:DNA-binding NtrC family response regulator